MKPSHLVADDKLVLFVLSGFPIVSESFVLRQMEGLVASGVRVSVVCLGEFDIALLERSSELLHREFIDRRLRVYEKSGDWIRGLTSGFLTAVFSIPQIVSLVFGLRVRTKVIYKAIVLRYLMQKVEGRYLVHSQFLTIGVAAQIAISYLYPRNKIDSVKHAVSVRGYDIAKRDAVNEGELKIVRKSDSLLLCVSDSLRRLAISRGVPERVCRIVYSGIDVMQVDRYLRECDKQSRVVNLVQVGRLVEKKGVRLSIELIARLRGRVDARLVVVGEGPELSSYLRLVDQLQVMDLVDFKGKLQNAETLQVISESDVLLVPSVTDANGDQEGIPNVAKEAMLLRCLVIGSDHSGMPELIDDGKTGFLFREGCIEDFVSTFLRAMESRGHWNEILSSARQSVKENFGIDATTSALLSAYDDLNGVRSE